MGGEDNRRSAKVRAESQEGGRMGGGDGWGGGGLRKDELITYLKKMGARRCLRDARRTGPLLCGINC